MSNLDARIALQQSRFTLIQESTNLDDEHAPRSSRQLVNARLDMLERNWNKFQDEHENLRLSDNDALSEHSYLKERVYERCQAFYVYARAKLLTHLDEFDTTDRHSRTTLSDRGAFTSLMPRSALPRIRLPTFSGDYQSWKSFHDLFTSLIKDNPDLSTVEKMHYLKTCVTGEAARLVGNLSISGDNFSIAWDLLISRYENKRFLIASQLDRIMSLKPLKTKCAQGLRTLLTTISEATAALRSLGCTVSSWDPLLLHHLVKLLDPESREAWEVKLGLSTTYPTYVQFEEFLIGRTRAMENIGLTSTTGTPAATPFGKHRARVAAHVAASTPATSNSVCPLCGSSHSLAKCESYQNKTAQQRKDIVIRNRRCFNCLAPHPVRKCQTTKRCLKCGKKHHTSIHAVHNETSKAMHYGSTSGTYTANPSEKKSEAQPPAD